MIKASIASVVMSSAIVLISGCDGESVYRDRGERTNEIRCGKITFSRQMADSMIAARMAMAEFQMRGASSRQLEIFRRSISSNIVAKLKQDFVVSNYLCEIGCSISKDAIDRRLNQMFKSSKKAQAFLESQLPEHRGYIVDFVRADLALEAARSQVVARVERTISEEEVSEAISNISRYNERALATNALVYAQATNCWREITGGKLTFLDASYKYDKSREQTEGRCYWGEFPLSSLSADLALCQRLPEMKSGDVTPPIEADNGLCIVQLIEVVQNEKKGSNLSPDAYYRLNKIFFELPIIYEIPTEKVVREELAKREATKLFGEFMKNQYRKFGF